jgi:hypothetical protein
VHGPPNRRGGWLIAAAIAVVTAGITAAIAGQETVARALAKSQSYAVPAG